jgi:hypothetical protein
MCSPCIFHVSETDSTTPGPIFHCHPTHPDPRAQVLSVIALQLLQIREARLLNLDSFVFEERQIPLKPTCGVMITMNPGYAGTHVAPALNMALGLLPC